MNESSNYQAPNPKEAPNLKLQYTGRTAVIGIWCLEFLWSLGFGVWGLGQQSIVNQKSRI